MVSLKTTYLIVVICVLLIGIISVPALAGWTIKILSPVNFSFISSNEFNENDQTGFYITSITRNIRDFKQAGYTYDEETNDIHAALKTGKNYIDLHSYLPYNFYNSIATDVNESNGEIWIKGCAYNTILSKHIAILWHYVEDYKLYGSVSYVTGSTYNYAVERTVTFTATDSSGAVLKTWKLALGFVNDSSKISKASYNINDIPKDTAYLSAKTDWHLRQRKAVTFSNGEGLANFLLLGGDINSSHDNIINVTDYNFLKSGWFSFSSQSDINGDGIVNVLDYNIMKLNWFISGDPQ